MSEPDPPSPLRDEPDGDHAADREPDATWSRPGTTDGGSRQPPGVVPGPSSDARGEPATTDADTTRQEPSAAGSHSAPGAHLPASYQPADAHTGYSPGAYPPEGYPIGSYPPGTYPPGPYPAGEYHPDGGSYPASGSHPGGGPYSGGGPYPGGYPGAMWPPGRPTNGLAVASLVLGIIWVYWLGSIAALILGYLARRQIRERGESGDGLAVAGIVLGWIGVGVLLIVLGLFVVGAAVDGFS
jgi:hypothetical protein